MFSPGKWFSKCSGPACVFARTLATAGGHFDVHEEVRCALASKKAVVALESTIITHGMPYPENVQCAADVERIVREQNAVPATIAIVNGKIKIGLTPEEINALGDTKSSKPIKTSRRDLAFVLSNKLNGGTTVAGTLLVADKAGIPVFATGGLGGVHRGAEITFDVSADLTELGRSNVAVVSSGVKSILDIPKTLEYLETQGVFVATLGDSNDFPAFYSRNSSCKSPYNVTSAKDAAKIIKTSRDMHLNSGLLFAIPVPEKYSLDSELIEEVIAKALHNMEKNVAGQIITPFLLSKIAELTGGKSLETNVALIKHNAQVAAEIAVALSNLDDSQGNGVIQKNDGVQERRPVIIGGSILDCISTLNTSDIKLDGRTYESRLIHTPGGVGRNICECLSKLGCPPNFISVLGDDQPGRLLKNSIPEDCSGFLETDCRSGTAQCIIVFDQKGDCKVLMGDLGINSNAAPEMISKNEHIIENSPLMVLDSNLSLRAMEEALRLAEKHCTPVFFEPTDLTVATKPFQTPHWKAMKFLTPNLNELRQISSFLNIPSKSFCSSVEEGAYLSGKLLKYLDTVVVTLGSTGVLVARKSLASDSFLTPNTEYVEHVRHYPTETVTKLVNVSGAGDCFSSGFIAALVKGEAEEICVSVGFAAAALALQSQAAVPPNMFDTRHVAWRTPASYRNVA